MNVGGGEAADQMVRMMLSGTEVAVRLSGSALKNLLALTMALASLTKQRTILGVRKKKRKKLYDALADVAALAQAKQLYEDGRSGMEAEYTRYMEAVAVLEQCGIPRERLSNEKAEIYEQLAQVNRDIRAERKKLALCQEIQSRLPQMEQNINKIEEHTKEVERDERRRR